MPSPVWQVFSELIGPAALVLVVWLGREWLAAKTKELAREGTEQALADYRHEQSKELAKLREAHEKSLHSLSAQNQRRFQEFSLYTQKQHEKYAGLYNRVRRASDAYLQLNGAMQSPGFEEWREKELHEYMKRHRVLSETSAPIIAMYARGDFSAGAAAMYKLHYQVLFHHAERAFDRARNYEALNQLYLSDEVRAQMDVVRRALAQASTDIAFRDEERAMRRHQQLSAEEIDRMVEEKLAHLGNLSDSTEKLLDIMRAELRRGHEAEPPATTENDGSE